MTMGVGMSPSRVTSLIRRKTCSPAAQHRTLQKMVVMDAIVQPKSIAYSTENGSKPFRYTECTATMSPRAKKYYGKVGGRAIWTIGKEAHV